MTFLRLLAPTTLALLGSVYTQAAPIFNFSGSTGNLQADAAFDAAAAIWSGLLFDEVTINLTRGFTELGPGILGSATNTTAAYSYGAVRNALINDVTSADDITATTNLQADPGVRMLINRTSDNPNGAGSATPYLDDDGDANNNNIRISNANARALGLLGPNSDNDGSITFSSLYSWDFDPSDGITPGSYDFMGVVAHEIGHLLGFISGVDTLDNNGQGNISDNAFSYVSVLDLYRYSELSGPGVIDWSADNRTKFFSLDGGTTSLTTFSNGINYGDGRQASHWKDNLGIGIMDPSASQGESLQISTLDLRGLDVIGWDLNASEIPEPGTISLGLFGLAALLLRTARKNS